MAACQTYDNKGGIKNAVIWAEMLQLNRYTNAVITGHYLKARMIISKALSEQVQAYFYEGAFTSFRYLNKML